MGYSLQKQVLYRLLAALAVSSLVVIAAAAWFQSRAVEKSVLSKERDEYDHFQGRIASLEQDWDAQATQLKLSLEFTRILESPKFNPELLNAFFLVRSSSSVFTRVMLSDKSGNPLFRYGIGEDEKSAFDSIAGDDRFFYFQPGRTLYRIFKLPVWMGQAGAGVLLLLTPLDNALLNHIAYPRTDLYLLFLDKPVASSLGVKGMDEVADGARTPSAVQLRYSTVSVPWKDAGSDGPSPVLVVRSQIEDAHSSAEIALIILASLVVLALASWRMLGAWINGIIGEIVALKRNSDVFARERKPMAVEELPDSGARGVDELGALKTGLASMMQTVLQSEKLYKDVMEALRRANDIKAAVVDTVDAMIVVLDTKGRFVSFNKACERATGFASRDVIGTCLWDTLIPAEEVDSVKGIFQSLVAGLFPSANENTWLTRDGGRRLISWSNTVLPDPSGEIEYVLATGIDITESRAAELALKQSEEKFRTIFNAANDVIFIHDIETGAIADVNQKVREMYGYDPGEMPGLGAEYLSSGAPPYSAEDAGRWLQKAAAGEPQLFEWHAKDKSGRLFWVEVNMRRARIGARDRIIVTVRDITESLRAEKELLLFRNLVDQSNDAFFVADADSAAILDVNDTACSSLGYARQELLALKLTDISDLVSDNASWRDRMELLRKRGAMVYESIHRRKDRSSFPVELSVRLYSQEGTSYLIGVARDITERKKTEMELRIKENAISNSINGIAISDMEGKITYVNRSYVTMLGYTAAGELLGRPLTDFTESPGRAVMIRETLRSKGGWIGELGGRRKDGSFFPRLMSASMVTDDQGRPISVLGSFVDITDIKQAEGKILAALEEKELLLKEIHHRVKNNLQIIASLLYLQVEEAADPKTRGLLQESRDRIKSMALVHEKLYSAPDLSRIDFMEYCEGLCAYLFNSYGAAVRGIRLETEGRGIFLEVDTAIPCGLIVSELISNALKYAFPGGRRGSVRITAELAPEGHLDLTIGDDGIGLPPGLALERANTLGLRLVHKLTGQLHGRIALVSGGGAVFHITVPLQGRKGKDLTNG